MDLTFSVARGFKFVLSLSVASLLITPVMSIYEIVIFWQVSFNMMESMEFGNLVGLLSSWRQFGKVYQG